MKSFAGGFLLLLSLKAYAALPFAPAEVGSARQIIYVEANGTSAQLSLYQKKENLWLKTAGPWPAVVGRNGVIPREEKREGDGHTPAGLYQLGFSFGADAASPATWAYKQMNVDDKWIDDPQAKDYNQFVRGKTDAKSFEKMKRTDRLYDLGLVIEYNTHPVVPGRGSAIFLHVWNDAKTGTAGCVALEKENVATILRWLDSGRDPRILIR